MKQYKAVCFVSLLLLIAGNALADHHAADRFAYSTYLYCDISQQQAADTAILADYAPVYDEAVKAGSISQWGWLAHHTGGKWRRALYYVAPSVEALLAAQQQLADKLNESGVINKACPSHEDYIWKLETGSKSKTRGSAGLSVYMICNLASEQRADEIVTKHFAPVFNRHIGKGQLTSWGWASHVLGGKYRRLATMTAASYPDLLKARQAILASLFSDKGPAEAAEFSTICTGHQDYLWDIQLETP